MRQGVRIPGVLCEVARRPVRCLRRVGKSRCGGYDECNGTPGPRLARAAAAWPKLARPGPRRFRDEQCVERADSSRCLWRHGGAITSAVEEFPEIAVAVIQVNGGCAAAPCLDDAKAAAVARACLHYGVPYLSYRRLLRPGTYGFEAWGGPELVSRPHHPKSILDRCPPHPPESVHTRVATVVALWWEGLEVRAAQWIPPRGGGWAVRQPSIANSFGEACVDPLATYDAVLGHSRAPLGLDASGWTIDQRRADKRGWQATAVGAAISFPLEFGPNPHVMITYTKGYDRFGNVRVTIPPSNRSFVLSGCCRTESVTQEKLAIARVGGNKFNDYYSDSSDGTVAFLDLGFQVPSFSSRELRLEIVSPTGHNRTTFRVNSVSSC